MKKYVFYLVVIVAVLSIIAFLLQETFPGRVIHAYFWYLLGAYVALLLLTKWIYFAMNTGTVEFTYYFIFIQVTAKLLLWASTFLSFRMLGVDGLKLLALNFFVLYICLTVFDITSLITNLRANLKKATNQ